MGIPYYFYVIARKYAGIVRNEPPPTCHHLLFDYNGLLHPASQQYLATLQKPPKDLEKGILQAIWTTTLDLINTLKPTATVQIYIDGVAPIAKMSQQRRRRYMSIYRKKLANLQTLWDSNAISPGTTFMNRLHLSLRSHIRYTKEFHFELSTADEPGEGEHKLFQKLIAKYNTPQDIKVIVGMDADLIMLSLMSNLPNIHLMRVQEDKSPQYLDVDALRLGILQDLKHSYHFHMSDTVLQDPFGPEATTLIHSYIVLCFILGNDFLPHPVHINLKKGGLEELLQHAARIWNNTHIPLVDPTTHTIQWTVLSQLLEALTQNETEKLYDTIEEYQRKRPHTEPDIENYPLQHKDLDFITKIDHNKWRQHYYAHLFHCHLADSSIVKQACDLYLKGIQWTYLYYRNLPKDPSWYYPWSYAPSLRDLSNHLHTHIAQYEQLKKQWKNLPQTFNDPITQLLCILPPESIPTLPPKYHTFIQTHHLHYLYPTQFKLHTFLKNQLWECSPILPPMNVQKIKELLLAY
jgi:5'-3' exonuclease